MEKVLVVCFLFLGDPAQNSGIGASTKFWHVKSFSLNYVWVVGMVPQTYWSGCVCCSTFSKVATGTRKRVH